MLANITSGVKDEAEDKVMGVKEEAEEKLEALINATAAAKGEVLDKVIDLKNATIAKVDMFALEKEEIMGGAKNVTSKFMDKKAMLMDEAVNVTAKFTDKKALIVSDQGGGAGAEREAEGERDDGWTGLEERARARGRASFLPCALTTNISPPLHPSIRTQVGKYAGAKKNVTIA